MIRSLVRVGMMVLLTVAGSSRAGPPREDTTHAEGELGERLVAFAQRTEAEGFSGAVLAAKGGVVVAAVGVGSADLKGEHPNTPATLFEIASLTKQFTAAAAVRLAQEGRLGLDDSIAGHLPGVPEDCRAITIEHLLRHTSGIPGTNAQGGGNDLERVLPSFLRGGPRHPPGTRWEYWNQGYAILSEIVARAAGKSYTDYCTEALFAPAGMGSTRFTGDEAPEGAAVAVGRSSRGAPRSALEHPYGSYGFQYRGMGGAVTSVWDLWRWDRALREEEVLSAGSKAELFRPGLGNYALGWMVRTDRRGRLVQSHGGGVRGFICEMRRYPEQDAVLIVLCNRDDAPLRRVADGLAAILFGEEASVEARGGGGATKTLDEATQNSLVGRYKDGKGNVLVVEADGATTRASVHWAPPTGPVTRAVLALAPGGGVMLDDGAERHPLAVERAGDEPAASITILGMIYRRTEE